MADAASPSSGDPPSLLSTVGEELVRIIAPVSACMLLVVLLVTALDPSSSSASSSLATLAYTEQDPPSSSPSSFAWDKLKGAVLNSLAFVAVITLLTFVLVLLFYLRCTRFLKSYMIFSSFVVLALMGGEISLSLIDRFQIPLDPVTFALLLLNLAVVGAVSMFSKGVPFVVRQSYLVLVGVLVAYWFTLLPEWTSWALLVAMALYDLAAVLLPVGPLRLLVELAISRDEEIPALVYEARPVEHRQPPPGPDSQDRRRLWRERPPAPEVRVDISSTGHTASPAPSSELSAPLISRRLANGEDGGVDGVDGIGLGSSGAIKLGLGDFIFYSVLVGRAAMFDFMTVYACYLAIIAGLGITLLLLAVYQKALPALPVSIALGVLFYFVTRALLEVFVVQCSINLTMF